MRRLVMETVPSSALRLARKQGDDDPSIEAAPTAGWSTPGSMSPASTSALIATVVDTPSSVTSSLSALSGKGALRLADRVRHVSLRSTRLANVTVNHTRHFVSVVALGRANGKPVRFTVTLTDDGARDSIAVRPSNGYRLSGRPACGGISL